MKLASKHILRLLLATFLSFAVDSLAETPSHDHDHDHDHAHDHAHDHSHHHAQEAARSHLHSLDVTIRPQRDGMIEVEQRFRLEVDGVSIKRGPAMNFMTVFVSDSGLVLDVAMEITEVTRNGKPEQAKISTSHGTTTLLIGRKDVFLENGPHDYVVRYRRLGSWNRQGDQLADSFDVTEAFLRFSIDRFTASLVLPEGLEFTRRSAAVTGTTADGPGFKTTSREGVFTVETTAPLAPYHSVFFNTSWSAEGFSGKSRLRELFLQHPRIPMAAIGSGVMVLALWVLLVGGIRRAKERRLALVAG